MIITLREETLEEDHVDIFVERDVLCSFICVVLFWWGEMRNLILGMFHKFEVPLRYPSGTV